MQNYQMNQPLALYRLSAIRISKELWSQSDLKHLMILCIIVKFEHKSFVRELMDLQNMLSARISDKINTFVLPQPVKKELRFIVASLGTKLWEWLDDRALGGDSSAFLELCIDYIHWTYYGSIDASATVESMYWANVLPENITWRELHLHCLEDCMIDFWPKELVRDKSGEERDTSPMAIYWDYPMANCSKEQLELWKERFRHHNEQLSVDQNMFEYSIRTLKQPGVKYFWKRLNNDQKMEAICYTTKKYIEADWYVLPESGFFVLQQLCLYKLDDLWSKSLGFPHVMLAFMEWPHRDLFVMAIDEAFMHDKCVVDTGIIHQIIISIDSSFLTTGEDCPYRKLFYHVWDKVVDHGETRVEFLKVLSLLWKRRDITLLSYIINDPRLKEKRGNYVSHIMRLIVTSQRDPIFAKKFMSTVLVSQEEREEFMGLVEHYLI